MIDVTYEIIGLYVYPEKGGLTNVVGKVQLKTTFSRNGASIDGRLEAILDTDSIAPDSFIDIDNLDVGTVANWAIQAQGGEEFLTNLKNAQEDVLQQKEREIGLVKYP
jgi:hypothetical protein